MAHPNLDQLVAEALADARAIRRQQRRDAAAQLLRGHMTDVARDDLRHAHAAVGRPLVAASAAGALTLAPVGPAHADEAAEPVAPAPADVVEAPPADQPADAEPPAAPPAGPIGRPGNPAPPPPSAGADNAAPVADPPPDPEEGTAPVEAPPDPTPPPGDVAAPPPADEPPVPDQPPADEPAEEVVDGPIDSETPPPDSAVDPVQVEGEADDPPPLDEGELPLPDPVDVVAPTDDAGGPEVVPAPDVAVPPAGADGPGPALEESDVEEAASPPADLGDVVDVTAGPVEEVVEDTTVVIADIVAMPDDEVEVEDVLPEDLEAVVDDAAEQVADTAAPPADAGSSPPPQQPAVPPPPAAPAPTPPVASAPTPPRPAVTPPPVVTAPSAPAVAETDPWPVEPTATVGDPVPEPVTVLDPLVLQPRPHVARPTEQPIATPTDVVAPRMLRPALTDAQRWLTALRDLLSSPSPVTLADEIGAIVDSPSLGAGYAVVPGDSLWSIAERLWAGQEVSEEVLAATVQLLHALNAGAIGGNADQLAIGTVLAIPDGAR